MKMKQFAVGLMLVAGSMTLLADAIARPMGGGRSFGRQSQNVTRQAPAPAPAVPRQAAAPTPAPAAGPQQARPPSRWKGILGGALLGLGLGALLAHFGLGGALASMLGTLLMLVLLALVVFVIFRLVRGKDSSNAARAPFAGFGGNDVQPAGTNGPNGTNGTYGTPASGPRLPPSAFQAVPAAPAISLAKPVPEATPWGLPPGFDTDGFLRQAKTSFIRLQAAWDKSDINDLREFTSTEVFAELKMQIQERNGIADFTDVVNVDATLLGIETVGDEYLASVQFDALIRSAPEATPAPMAEVWNLARPVSGSTGWVLAGIQQLS